MKKKSLLVNGSILVLALALVVTFCYKQAIADQPHMQQALKALQDAKAELQKAASNKGGHRAKALSLVNDAIEEVQLGIAAGSTPWPHKRLHP